jgi:hypothetical protein
MIQMKQDSPYYESSSSLRPDGWILTKDGHEIIIELTVPYEENILDRHIDKTLKYKNLLYARKKRNKNTRLMVFEVGTRGLLVGAVEPLRLFIKKNLGSKQAERMFSL